jgi:Fe(3+) dicitrate transport protein
VAAGRGTAFKNLGKVNTQGLEIRTDFLLSKLNTFLPNLGVTYTYLSTKVVDGTILSNIQPVGQAISINNKKLPYSPDHTLNVGIELNPVNSFFFRVDMKYVSKVYTDFQNLEEGDDRVGYNLGISGPIPSYSLINLSSSYQVSGKMKLFLSGKNIMDKKYIGSRLHSNPGQKDANISSGILPGPRRQINMGIEYTF